MSTIVEVLNCFSRTMVKELAIGVMELIYKHLKWSVPPTTDESTRKKEMLNSLIAADANLFVASNNPFGMSAIHAAELLTARVQLFDLANSSGNPSSSNSSSSGSSLTSGSSASGSSASGSSASGSSSSGTPCGSCSEENSIRKRKFEEIEEKFQTLSNKFDQFIMNNNNNNLGSGTISSSVHEKMNKIIIDQTAEEYVSSRFSSLNSTSVGLNAEYDSLKNVARSVVKLSAKLPNDDSDAKELLGFCEKRALVLQMLPENPKVANKLSQVLSKPIYQDNLEAIEAAYKLVKIDHNVGKDDTAKELKRVANFSKVQKGFKENKFEKNMVKRCFNCQQVGHIATNCPNKANNNQYSNEQFFRPKYSRRRNSRKISSNSLSFQSLGRLAKKWCFSTHCGNVKRRCESESKPRFSSIQRKCKFERMGGRRKKLVVKRGGNPSKNWCNRRMHRPCHCFKVQIGPQERFIPFNYRYEAIESVLSNKKIQVQNFEEISRVCTKRGHNRNLRLHVRYEIRVPSSQSTSRVKEIFCLRSKWQNISIHSASIWLEWFSILLYRNYERSCKIIRNRFNALVELFRRFWYITFSWFITSIEKFNSIGSKLSGIRYCDRKKKEYAKTYENISIIRNNGRFRKEDSIHEFYNHNQNQKKNWSNSLNCSRRKEGFTQRFVSSNWISHCLSRLFSTCQSNVESNLFICCIQSVFIWMAWVLSSSKTCYPCPSMDFSKCEFLEWKGVSISKSGKLFLDRCFQDRLGSSLQSKGFKNQWSLVERRSRTIDQCFRIKSCLEGSARMEGNLERKVLNNLLGFYGSSTHHKKWWFQIEDYQSNCSINLENNLRVQYSSPFIGMVVFSREFNCGRPEQNSNRNRSNGLGNFNRFLQPSSAAIECINRIRSICQPVQFQGDSLLYKTQNQQGNSSRFILPPVDRTSGQLVLRPLQSNRESNPTLHRIQSSNGSCSSSVEIPILVENFTNSESEIYRTKWQRFQTFQKREGGTMEKVMEIRSNSVRCSLLDLNDIAMMLLPHHIRDSTAKTYDSYWNRLIRFAITNKFDTPPSEELVFLFLTDMFITWPSGDNCRNGMYAIKNRCKLFGVPDPTLSDRIKLLISGMCNLSAVFKPRERHPWSIVFIRQWVKVGRSFVPEKTFTMYTTLMIIGLRAMFRGSELGNLLVEDVKISLRPVRGYRVTARKIKNDPKGRTACIEATDTELCPFKWIQKLLQTRDTGPYLFASHFAMDTKSISWILRQIAIWLSIEGKFSSHSLRIGGASDAAFAKLGKEATKAIGDWSSDAIDRYLRSEFSIDRNVSKDLGF